MNILFITLFDISDINKSGIYEDLLREFINRNQNVFVVSPTERRNKNETYLINEKSCSILKVKIGNIQKTNVIEKGISTILLEKQFVNAIKKYYCDVKFDLVLYSTPPITVLKSVQYIKERDGAKSYLLLKDIFPQNAVDIGMLSKNGLKGIIYKYFRAKEKKLYALSDRIGCMSNANIKYILKFNPEISKSKVELSPNCIEVRDRSVNLEQRKQIRQQYGIPLDKKVFIYGGNLGKPQGIPFLVECLKSQINNDEVFFLIIGSGTEYSKLEEYVELCAPKNFMLMKQLPKEDYDIMVGSCDVGMIFLDHRFTIPNFPSRLLSYMQAKLPVLAVTDTCTDIGEVIVGGDFGWWCESNNKEAFADRIKNILLCNDLKEMGENAYIYLLSNYDSKYAYSTIIKFIESN